MTKEAHDFLMSAGVPSAKFPEIGSGVVGQILSYEKSQQRDIGGTPKTWDSGEPMWQIVFTLQTEENDPEIEGDDGVRKLYAAAKMLNAIREAVRKAGHQGDLVGGKLGVKFVAEEKPPKPGYNAPKVYAAKFKAPDQTDDLGQAEPEEAPPSPAPEYSDEPF